MGFAMDNQVWPEIVHINLARKLRWSQKRLPPEKLHQAEPSPIHADHDLQEKKNCIELSHYYQYDLVSTLTNVDFNLLSLCPPSLFWLFPSFSLISPFPPSSSSACLPHNLWWVNGLYSESLNSQCVSNHQGLLLRSTLADVILLK